jgi:hypothetical protein
MQCDGDYGRDGGARVTKEEIYLDIRKELYARHRMAAYGPAHVCIDDGNWDFYQVAIDACNLILAYRALNGLGIPAPFLLGIERLGFVYDLDFYAEHSTAEIADTLEALRLIGWHEEGYQTEGPPR